MKLRIGTRGSALARTQATTIANALTNLGHTTELVIIRTSGDDSSAPSFASIGPQGVFVREIEQALLDERIDVAVHSCKDLPTSSPDALVLAAIPARVDPADVLIATTEVFDASAGVLPVHGGAVIGTSSARRQSWLRHLRPDLEPKPLRGNVPTRIGKIGVGYDAILLAAAGLARLRHSPLEQPVGLDLDTHAVTRLDPDVFVPAPAQGALALQCGRDAANVVAALAALDDALTHACIDAERRLLARVEGGCDLALGAYCTRTSAGFTFVAMLERDGRVATLRAQGDAPAELADTIWDKLATA